MADDNTSNRGLGSDNMDEQTKKDIQSKGGSTSPTNFANRDEDEVEEIARRGGQASGGGNNS